MAMQRSRSYFAVNFDADPSSDSSSDQEQRSRGSSRGGAEAGPPYTAAKHASDAPLTKRVKGYMLYCYYRAAAVAQSERVLQALTLLTLLAVLALWVLHAREHRLQSGLHRQQSQHLVLIDAGSTGTRVHVFKYQLPGAKAHHSYVSLVLPEPKLKVSPGLSSYAEDPAAAAASLAPLLQFAYQHVPREQWGSTPVRLMATAGLRLLPPRAAARVLQHCKDALAASHFHFEREWAEVISGEAEGVYGWVAVNTVAGTLQEAATNLRSRKEPRHDRFHGLLELGGASVQVTFVPEQHSPAHKSTSMVIPGVTRPLFTHSYLGLGFDIIEAKVKQLVKERQAASGQTSGNHADPCLPKGFASDEGHQGLGNWRACQQLVAHAMDPANCNAPLVPCTPTPPANVPRLTGTFLAIENFFWTAQALQLPRHATIDSLSDAGSLFCEQPWNATLAARKPGQDSRLLWRYCFGSAFVWTLLHDVFRIGHREQLHFTNSLLQQDRQEVGLDWAIGAAALQLTQQAARMRLRAKLRLALLVGAVAGTLVVVALAVVLLLQFRGMGQLQRKAAGIVLVREVHPLVNGYPAGKAKAHD